jgi:hypothetical protein
MPEPETASAVKDAEQKRPLSNKALFPLLALSGWLVALAAIYWQFEPTDCGSSDTGVYLSGAKSLAEGRGYRFVAYANEPSIALYPPVHSAYLSLLWQLNPNFPENIPLLYWGMILVALAVIGVLAAYWWRERMAWPALAILAVTWSLSPIWCWQLGTFFSDVLFVLLFLGVAWCWVGAEDWDSSRRWFATGLLMALLYLTRTAALAPLLALAAVTVWRAFHRKWQPALAYLAPALSAVIFWKLFTAGNVTYADTFRCRLLDEGGWGGMFAYWGQQALDYISGACFLRALFPWLMKLPGSQGLPAWELNVGTALLMVCGWLFMACCVRGFWRSQGIVDRLSGVIVGSFLVEVALWPFPIGERAVFTVLPFVLLWTWRGMQAFIENRPTMKWPAWATAALVGVSAVGNVLMLPDKSVEWNQHNQLPELTEVALWTRDHTPAQAIVAASWGHPVLHFHHYSNRKVVQDELDQRWEQVVRPPSKDEFMPDYLLCSRHKPLTNDLAGNLHVELVKRSQNGFYSLYRFERTSPTGTAAVASHD